MRTEDEEALVAALWELGTVGAQSLAAEGEGSVLLAYFPERPGLRADLEAALSPLGATVVPAEVPAVDWVARVREGFRAFDAGGFRIVPAWEATDGPARARVLVVEPGLAFGTGTHESTRLVLRLLEARAAAGPLGRVADIGAGSGILSVAAGRLGAQAVVAVETDPEALPVAARHRALNGVALHLVRGDGGRPLRPRAFDLLLANLSAGLLAARAGELSLLLRPRGAAVLAGLLLEDVPEVRRAWEGVSEEIEVATEGAWAALLARARP